MAQNDLLCYGAGQMSKKQPSMASFGFRDVKAEDKPALIKHVFDRVAPRYDMMNDIMSAGLHRLWKTHLVSALAVPHTDQPFAVLDVASGTGDIALKLAQRGGAGLRVTCLDMNHDMLAFGEQKSARLGQAAQIEFVVGDAQALPMANETYQAYIIAFGMRNVTSIEQTLKEAHRILKPPARFLCLEFSHVTQPLLSRLYDMWSFKAIPPLGRLITGTGEPYRYLIESIRRFPKPEELTSLMDEAGFIRTRFELLNGGIVALHSGWKI